jgi:hypothetical protein
LFCYWLFKSSTTIDRTLASYALNWRCKMKTGTGYPESVPPPAKPLWRCIFGWPSTRLGWWSVGLAVGFIVLFGVFQTLVASGQRGGETFFSNPWLALSILPAAVSAIAGGVAAAGAILWRRERSLFSIVALFLGILVAVFVLGEILVPH